IPPDNLLEFAEVARAVRIPIATGERFTTKSEFATVLRTGGVKILQPALGRLGGIMEAKKLAAIAEVFNAEMAPHLYAGPVEWAANIHFAASVPNLLIAETIETGGAFHLALIKNSIKWENGYILPPDAPGLGIDFDEDLARAHPYTGTKLHLEMQEAPCDYLNGNRFEGGAPSSPPSAR
ncbi:MAG: mandelate racemase/muconate lactonizing enzyme family protein, partial [Paracoccaceae bacterium]|nr:mandelate racemase/muconate lactonizing enzyme family protein [Paracoccaceae bacterium]